MASEAMIGAMGSPVSEAYALMASHRGELVAFLFVTILSRSLRPVPASAVPFPRGAIRIRFRSHRGNCATWLHELLNKLLRLQAYCRPSDNPQAMGGHDFRGSSRF